MARHVHVECTPDAKRLLVDGEVFEFYTTVDGFHISVTPDGVPGVTLTIVAERVTVDHTPFETVEQ